MAEALSKLERERLVRLIAIENRIAAPWIDEHGRLHQGMSERKATRNWREHRRMAEIALDAVLGVLARSRSY